MKKNLYEVFDEFQKGKTEGDKRRVLVDNATPDLIGFLQLSFDPRVKFVYNMKNLPEYKPGNHLIGMGYTNMGNAVKKSYLFIEGHPRRNPDFKGKQMDNALIGILESLENREAELYLSMLKKQVKVPGLTKTLVEKTFPGIFENKINI